MAEPEMSPATRLDDLAALDPLTRREVASALGIAASGWARADCQRITSRS